MRDDRLQDEIIYRALAITLRVFRKVLEKSPDDDLIRGAVKSLRRAKAVRYTELTSGSLHTYRHSPTGPNTQEPE